VSPTWLPHIVLESRGGVRTTQAAGAIVALDRVEDVVDEANDREPVVAAFQMARTFNISHSGDQRAARVEDARLGFVLP